MKTMTEKAEEKLPISEFNKVIDYITMFKSQKWWEAVVLFEAYGKRAIGLYLWEKRKDAETGVEVWKRKHKFNIRNLDEWNKLKDAIEQLTPKLVSK
jgi:hypothetical protein